MWGTKLIYRYILVIVVFLTYNMACWLSTSPTTEASASDRGQVNQVINLSVDGLDCVGCTDTIVETLMEDERVAFAKMWFDSARAEVGLVATATTPEFLKSILARWGYSAKITKISPVHSSPSSVKE